MGVCTDRIELKKRNDLFRDAAENSLAIQERANRREDQLNEEIKKREEKLRATEARCIDLLQLKMGYERDILGFKSFSLLHLTPRELFENPVFRPDGLKLYPTLVIRGTGLYELWKKGQYRNYPPK